MYNLEGCRCAAHYFPSPAGQRIWMGLNGARIRGVRTRRGREWWRSGILPAAWKNTTSFASDQVQDPAIICSFYKKNRLGVHSRPCTPSSGRVGAISRAPVELKSLIYDKIFGLNYKSKANHSLTVSRVRSRLDELWKLLLQNNWRGLQEPPDGKRGQLRGGQEELPEQPGCVGFGPFWGRAGFHHRRLDGRPIESQETTAAWRKRDLDAGTTTMSRVELNFSLFFGSRIRIKCGL